MATHQITIVTLVTERLMREAVVELTWKPRDPYWLGRLQMAKEILEELPTLKPDNQEQTKWKRPTSH